MPHTQLFRESLEQEAEHILEECRIIVPGIQALIGFQMIAFFNQAFYDKLAETPRFIHFTATCLSIVAMFCLLTPSAYQRIAEPGEVSRFFVKLASHLIFAAMAFLRLALTIDVYVLTRALGIEEMCGRWIAGGLFIFGWFMWSGIPRLIKLGRKLERT